MNDRTRRHVLMGLAAGAAAIPHISYASDRSSAKAPLSSLPTDGVLTVTQNKKYLNPHDFIHNQVITT